MLYNIKKVIIICLIALLVVIPTAYASNNQTDFELNDNILSDSYYFDANVDVSGNGSLNSPYKTLRNNVHDVDDDEIVTCVVFLKLKLLF